MRLKFSGPKGCADPPEGINERRHDNEILNMSTTGACIRTSTRHEPGKRVIFELNLSDAEEKITKTARVQWVKPDDRKFYVGIKFI